MKVCSSSYIAVIGKLQHVIFIRLYHSLLYSKLSNNEYMWQSWVKIEHYSIAYCGYITALEVL